MLKNLIPVGIKTCKDNYIKQCSVRDTWMNSLDRDKFYPIFLIGDEKLEVEYKLIDDILYVKSSDSYTGLCGKLKMYYKWATENFNVTHFWTCDDDSYINTTIFNSYKKFYEYDYLGFFLYGIDKVDKKSGYASGCAVCLSSRCADICKTFLPMESDERHYDDIIIGDIINEKIDNPKKYHETMIHPWSNCKKIDNLLFGHYIYHATNDEEKKLNQYQLMKKMDYMYCQPSIHEKINNNLFFTCCNNIDSESRFLEQSYSVPKNIHFIWIGSIIPKKYIENILKCREINSEYKIYVHLDHEIPLDFKNNIQCINIEDSINTDQLKIINKLNTTIDKADTLRYMIIYNYGGIYSDVDAIFIKPYDNYLSNSFVTHIDGYYNITNSCFGFNRYSNFLKFMLDYIANNLHLQNSNWPMWGPNFMTSCFKQYNDYNIKTINQKYLIYNTDYCYSYHTHDKNW